MARPEQLRGRARCNLPSDAHRSAADWPVPATGRRAANSAAPNLNREVLVDKLKLPVDGLRVETFDPGGTPEARGTVNAMITAAGGACCTRLQTGCNPDITSIYTGRCCPP
jgi:hypothetical protein